MTTGPSSSPHVSMPYGLHAWLYPIIVIKWITIVRKRSHRFMTFTLFWVMEQSCLVVVKLLFILVQFIAIYIWYVFVKKLDSKLHVGPTFSFLLDIWYLRWWLSDDRPFAALQNYNDVSMVLMLAYITAYTRLVYAGAWHFFVRIPWSNNFTQRTSQSIIIGLLCKLPNLLSIFRICYFSLIETRMCN